MYDIWLYIVNMYMSLDLALTCFNPPCCRLSYIIRQLSACWWYVLHSKFPGPVEVPLVPVESMTSSLSGPMSVGFQKSPCTFGLWENRLPQISVCHHLPCR